MSCGVCNPELFREALLKTASRKARVFGYTAQARPFKAVRNLYFYGCQHVLWDAPSKTNTMKRKQLSLILRLMRKGDVLVIDKLDSLASRPEAVNAHIKTIKNMGLTLFVLTEDD